MIICGSRIKSSRKIVKKNQTISEGMNGMVMRIDASEVYVKFENGSLLWVDLKDVRERRDLC